MHPSSHKKTEESGFVALITAMVLSFILILITVTLNQSGFFTRSALLEAEYKERSSALAEACARTALLKITNDAAYAGNETETIGTDTCRIRLINPAVAGEQTIETQAVYQQATTNLQVVVSVTSVAVISWIEVPQF